MTSYACLATTVTPPRAWIPAQVTRTRPVTRRQVTGAHGAMSMSTTADSAGGQDHAELDAGLMAGVTDRGVRPQRNEDAIALATVHTADGPVPLPGISDRVSS